MSDLMDYINEQIKSPEQRRFKMVTLFDYHLSLYQDFNRFNFQFIISKSDCDEYNWFIGLFVAFWGFEFSWNGRKNLLKKK